MKNIGRKDIEIGIPIVHPKILVHWTMKLSDNPTPDMVTDRLKNILSDQGGLLYNWPKNEKVKMLCFTETRLSESIAGAVKLQEKYGVMGIGLHRKYVMSHGGNPVFYINPFDTAELRKELPSGSRIRHFMKDMNEKPPRDSEVYDLRHYDDLEWRIVFPEGSPKYLRLTRERSCVECIILPNDDCKASCMEFLKEYFYEDHFPVVSTLNRIKHF